MPETSKPEIRKLGYGEAVNAALHRLMEELPETLVYGEDVGVPGGVFGVTRGLRKSFGARVFDTPISEAAILGSAVGAAMMGRRPIVEIMWADFSLVALDQIVNQAANVRYVSAGRLTAPLTIRTQQGNAPGACAQHSQCLEALFLHVPGLRVCMPSTPQDAYDLLVTAVHCDDPVLVIENRTLYFGARQEVTVGGPVPPMGGVRVRHPGSDVTVVTWGAMTWRAVEAAELLAGEGIGVEVVETPWLNPFDTEAVVAAAGRTRRLAVVHEANVTGGFGAEVVARVAQAGVPLLAPPIRIGAPDVRMPAAPVLAQALLPDADRIAGEVRTLVRG
ncbi:pyruvate/2-oxoglutarate/acetoin dehydrogenase E1 component [Thermocatellispora tengchongensis]|uniref:Pyruvate/2-oxoglutarate/acetoin dehydrogenase E1 component n=1 Tax=Thermocatellispora tengchongensis TaxID=1073253 RepID=A0A840PQ14_9ACTN|nr:transketolase C-terminal domain-containing protein [Thermocatellispora tengchongensis]MBB5138095.1 pyruvate/2-oxoglutarate/acetoin dehydrogenase E1 component [Thermocatellispora tengchongensis]